MDYSKILNQYRKKPIAAPENLRGSAGFSELSYRREDIKKIIPHRDPFLLVDELTGLYLSPEEQIIFGKTVIPASDPVFKGHFPGFPVYPGCLQIEMGGQLGLCLSYFATHKTSVIAGNAKPVQVRVTKVLGAQFLEAVLPDKELILISKNLESDSYLGTAVCQVLSEGKICCVGIFEVFFVDAE